MDFPVSSILSFILFAKNRSPLNSYAATLALLKKSLARPLLNFFAVPLPFTFDVKVPVPKTKTGEAEIVTLPEMTPQPIGAEVVVMAESVTVITPDDGLAV